MAIGPQTTRAPLAPPISNLVNARVLHTQRSHIPINGHRIPRVPPPVAVYDDVVEVDEENIEEDRMDVEEDGVRVVDVRQVDRNEHGINMEGAEEEVEAMIIVDESDEEDILEEERDIHLESDANYVWPDAPTHRRLRYAREVEAVREVFEDDPDYDPAMVSEYADDIFTYMQDLEVCRTFSQSILTLTCF